MKPASVLLFALASASAMAATGHLPSAHSTDEWLIDTFESEDEPPEYTATAMVQTPDGYLWFGTFGGLERFDGVKLTHFDPDNTPQLPSGGIVNLHLDKRGWLWISTYRGIVVRQHEKWRRFGMNDGWIGDYVRTFAERTNGDLLMTTFDGHVLEFSKDVLKELPSPPGDQANGYLSYVDEAGRWWVIQNRFIGQWDGARWVQIVDAGNLNADVVGRGKARDGGLWLLLNKQLLKYREGKEVSRVDLPVQPGGIWDLFEDSRTNVWICTYDKGLCLVDPNGLTHRWTRTNGLPVDGVRFVFEDNENDLWVGTSAGGLTRFKPRRIRSLGREQGLTAAASSVCPDGHGGLWVGTYGGGLFQCSDSKISSVSLKGITNAVTYLHSVLADSKGRLWLGTFLHGLWLAEEQSARAFPPEQTCGNNLLALFEGPGKQIWVAGGGRGVSIFDGKQFRCIGSQIMRGPATSFAEDKNGVIWISDETGVYRIEKEQLLELKTKQNQPIKRISCFSSDQDGSVWMGSLDRGLLRWRDGQWATLDQQCGLPDAAIYSMIEDGAGVFWVVTGAGILRIAHSNLSAVANRTADRLIYQLLDRSDGLPGSGFSTGRQPTCARDANGKLWFAAEKGLASIDPKEFRLNAEPPRVHIETVVYHTPKRKLQSETNTVSPRAAELEVKHEAPFAAPLRLTPGSHRLEIQYTSTSFSAPEKVRFQVKLEGHDLDWQDVANRRIAYYYELPPGAYSFRVRAANNDGVWNETGTAFAFTVLPFFWQTAWFRGLTGFAVIGEAGLIIALLANRRRLNRAQADLKESEWRLKMAGHAARLGMWVWEIPRDEIWITEDGRRLFGWSKTETVGFERFISTLYPEDREPVRRAVQSALNGKGDYEAEHRVIITDGGTRWIAARGQVEFNEQGKPVRIRGVSIDITERKHAEERFRLAVEASPSGIVLVNEGGRIVLVNSQTETLFGYTREELIGQTVELLVPERMRGRHPGYRSDFLRSPHARAMGAGRELFGLRKDGTEFPVEIGLSPIQSEAGMLVLTVIVDITARKQAEAETQRQRAELAHVARVSTMGELAASVAHELNQPLGAILANAEAADLFLKQDPPALGEVRDILEDIRKDDERAGEVIRRMRTLLRKREMELQELDLNSVVEDVLRLVSGDAALRKMTITAELSPLLPAVKGDRVHLQQVMLNLAMNAMEAMARQPAEKRRLNVSTVLNGAGTVELAISDSGHGIDPRKMGSLFEPFFTTKPNGMGMGLSIARRIIEAHHGHISAENNVAGGATFRVVLPVAGERSGFRVQGSGARQ